MPRLTEAQLADRRIGLGSTDVVEAMGLAPWQDAGPMRLYLEKAEGVERELDEDAAARFDWGHRLEAELARWYSETMGVTLLPGGHVPHREHAWLWATIDFKAPDRGIECKHVSSGMAHHWDESAEDGVPRYVRGQVTIAMACLGVRLFDVVADVGGRPPHVWTVAWDQALADLLLSGADRFWKRVLAKTPPDLDATEATRAMLARRWPTNEDRVMVPAGPVEQELAEARIMAAIEEGVANGKKILADVKLLERIGSADGIRGEDWIMTWKIGKDGRRRQRFTAKALRDWG